MNLNLLKDALGDFNLAEIGGAVSLAVVQACAVYWTFIKGNELSYAAYGAACVGLISGIAAAQRLRGDPEIVMAKIAKGQQP
jgi:sugar phosphate permease